MIYFDYMLNGEKCFYKFEGNSFEIIELRMGKEKSEYKDQTKFLYKPIIFTIKTDIGEVKQFEIDTGYSEWESHYNSAEIHREYAMNWFFVVENNNAHVFECYQRDEENKKLVTNMLFHKQVEHYFEEKIKPATDILSKIYNEQKKLQKMESDFSV